MTRVFLGVSLFWFASAVGITADDRNDGLEQLQGSWAAVSRERDGEKKETPKLVVTFKGDKFETVVEDKVVESGTIKVDTSKRPNTYSVTITGEFSEKGNTYHAIYEVEGETLKTCANTHAGKEAPREFATKAGTGHQLIVWKRVKR